MKVQILLLFAFFLLFAQNSVAQFSPEDTVLVDIQKINPRIVVEIKYATDDNFTGRKLYTVSRCFLRKFVALKLDSVQRELEKFGLGLKVWDCYRPLSVQKILWSIVPDERYVANPAKGSRHNRGCAVDLTLVDSSGKELPMPTKYDDFSEKAHRDYYNLPDTVIKNRKLLEDVMKKYGFIPLPTEWWHFDSEGWERFSILDIPLEELVKDRKSKITK
ncbi:MAG: M15 family metallopeptidase [Candidatus Kryptonium sp.]|nr:M15 family metallopeptidase [Candidatus Kryptonium sp.]